MQPAPVTSVGSAYLPPSFEQAYAETFDFVWRNAIRLGVPRAWIDDVVQDVFIVVHRQLPHFEGRSSLTTWVFTILRRTAKDYRRKAVNNPTVNLPFEATNDVAHDDVSGPHETAARRQAIRTLHDLLNQLDDEKREVFLLAELEQWGAPEIAQALSIPVNTVYSRLRLAREQFSAGVARARAKDDWRLR